MNLRRSLHAARLRLFARHVGASSRPVVLGPFRSEVGFEVLYWLPFLAHLRKTYGWDKRRLIALSRGGMSTVYDTAGTADLYDFLPVETVRLKTWAAHQRSQTTKQYTVEPWERNVVQLAASSLGLAHPIMVHPAWMYRTLSRAWIDKMAFNELGTWLDVTPLPLLPLPEGLVLPDRFLAVRFYARATMTPHDGVTLFLRQQLTRLAEKQPLVFLSNDDRYDDHADILRPFGPNMVDLGAFLTPNTNLATQVAVLQRATAFLGTYGGLAQLALRCQRPVFACYTSWEGTAHIHLDLTHRLALAQSVPFYMLRVQDLESLMTLW